MRPIIVVFLTVMMATAPAYAVPTNAQLCESAIELASAKYAQCRMNAESRFSRTLDANKRTSALAKCSENLTGAFAKANDKYGAACAATESSTAFDDYLTQCSDDATAAAAGATLPDYLGDLATCNDDVTTCTGDLITCSGDLATCDVELSTCSGDLTTCTTDLATAEGDLTTCESDLAACEALPAARVLKTGQTTSYGTGTDGDLELGVVQNYVDNGDGTITDTNTGLMWEKKSDDGSIHDKDNFYTWGMGTPPYTMNGTVVTTFLATLNSGSGFGGHTDWRLPNLRELESLVNLEPTSAAWTFPAFNTGCAVACTVLACSCTHPSYYWSSTTVANQPQYAWIAYFGSGSVDPGEKGNAIGAAARAVRTAP